MKLYAGIDLHGNNHCLVIIDEQDQVVYRKRQKNDWGMLRSSLEPYREQLTGLVVESTYNWYWMVDSLQEDGWRVHLANPLANRQYAGIKETNDWTDSMWLAHLLRLGILAEGYIYPKEQRAVRDLLRKRLQLVQQRTAQILSLQGWITRQTGKNIPIRKLEGWLQEEGRPQFVTDLALVPEVSLRVIHRFHEEIHQLDAHLKKKLQADPASRRLEGIWGIGEMLSRTILLETGPIQRFPSVGDYCSYCRVVPSQKWSNGKKKGKNNSKCGNPYLSWAFSQAAHYAAMFYETAKRYTEKKSRQRGKILGHRALAHKLCRATYYILRDQVEFDPTMLFGSTSGSRSENPAKSLVPNPT